MRFWVSCFFLLGVLLPLCSLGTSVELKAFYQHDFTVSDASIRRSGQVFVLPSVNFETNRGRLKSDYVGALTKNILSRSGVPVLLPDQGATQKLIDSLRSTRERHVLPGARATEVLAPKLFIEVSVSPGQAAHLVNLDVMFVFLGYLRQQSKEAEFKPEVLWEKHVALRDLESESLQERTTLVLRRELETFVPVYRKQSALLTASLGSSGGGTITTEFVDRAPPEVIPPAPRDRFFQAGISLGTPTYVNLNLGLWGWGVIPLQLHLTGMYYSADNRGFQLEVGYIVKRTGDFQTAISTQILLFNSSRDEVNRVNGSTTQIVRVNELKPFLTIGPGFVGQWRGFRLQTGFGVGISPENAGAFRFLIQLGYVPLFPF